VGIEIELLKYKSDLRSKMGKIDTAVVNGYAIGSDLTALYGFQFVDTPDESALSRPARTADDNDLSRGYMKIDIVEDV